MPAFARAVHCEGVALVRTPLPVLPLSFHPVSRLSSEPVPQSLLAFLGGVPSSDPSVSSSLRSDDVNIGHKTLGVNCLMSNFIALFGSK